MKTGTWCRRLAIVLCSAALGGCASFSATRSAEVSPGIAVHVKGGLTSPPSRETYWFYDLLGDCSLCKSSSLPITEVGFTYGSDRSSIGLFLSGPDPQLELYRQLHRGTTVAYGVGGRVGLFPSSQLRSGQLFFLLDRQLSRDVKLLVDPGLYYLNSRSPNGWNRGSFLFFTPSIGLAIESGGVTLTPSIAMMTGKGDLSISGDSRKFNDTFVSASLGISFHKRKE